MEGKLLQMCPNNAGVPRGSIPGPTLCLFICNIAIYANDTTVYSKYN